jgi:acetamidase/formamidase
MPAASTVTVRLKKGRTIPGPRIETPTDIMTVVSGTPMERSAAQAYAQLILWMEADYDWNRWQAYDLLTHVAQTSIGYYGIGTIGVKVAKRYLN